MVWIADSTAQGNASSLGSWVGGDGGDGITLINSVAHIARSVIQGAPSSGLRAGWPAPAAPGSGPRAASSSSMADSAMRRSGRTHSSSASQRRTHDARNRWNRRHPGRLELARLRRRRRSLRRERGRHPCRPATPFGLAAGSIVEARAEQLPTVSITPAIRVSRIAAHGPPLRRAGRRLHPRGRAPDHAGPRRPRSARLRRRRPVHHLPLALRHARSDGEPDELGDGSRWILPSPASKSWSSALRRCRAAS